MTKESRRAGTAEYVTKESQRAGAAEYVTKDKQWGELGTSCKLAPARGKLAPARQLINFGKL